MAQLHICGVCQSEFDNEKDYLAHVCDVTGKQPTDIQHLVNSTTPEAEQIAQAATDRGASKPTKAKRPK